MNNSSQKSLNYKRINDYKPFNFTIPEITLDFIIETDKVKVVSIFTLTKNDIRSEELKLKGEKLEEDLKIINSAIENFARTNKSEYFWIHRRFKNQPEGEESFYPEEALR